MKRIAFIVSWLYKTFTPSNILVMIFHMCMCDDVTLVNEKVYRFAKIYEI